MVELFRRTRLQAVQIGLFLKQKFNCNTTAPLLCILRCGMESCNTSNSVPRPYLQLKLPHRQCPSTHTPWATAKPHIFKLQPAAQHLHANLNNVSAKRRVSKQQGLQKMPQHAQRVQYRCVILLFNANTVLIHVMHFLFPKHSALNVCSTGA